MSGRSAIAAALQALISTAQNHSGMRYLREVFGARVAVHTQFTVPTVIFQSNILEIHDSVTSISSYAFYGCDSLTSVTFAITSSWKAGTYTLSETNLANASTAAQYLTVRTNYNNYYQYNWTRT